MAQNAIGPFVVTANDGRMFYCSLEADGRERTQRWIFRDTHGKEYIGPMLRSERTAEDVRKMVAHWWAARETLDGIDESMLTTRSRLGANDS